MRAEVLNEGRATAKTKYRRLTTEEAKRRGQQQVENDCVELRMNQVFSLLLAAKKEDSDADKSVGNPTGAGLR